jgi:hypothetical protein
MTAEREIKLLKEWITIEKDSIQESSKKIKYYKKIISQIELENKTQI